MSGGGTGDRVKGPRSGRGDRASDGVAWEDPSTLEVCVVGAGAVGGLIGGKLALAGADVTLVDRGSHRRALEETGLRLVAPDGRRTQTEDLATRDAPPADRPMDLVVLGVKSYDLPAIAPTVSGVVGPETAILPVQNGIPWWYFHRFGGDLEGHRLTAADPDGLLERHVDSDRVIGCVPFVAATVVEPGTIHHTEGEWFPVGELDGAETVRAQGVASLFERAGLRSRVLEDVRSELWLKALGNLAFNPISALARATLAEVCREPATRALARAMMEEAKPVAEDLGVEFRRSIEDRIDGAEAVGDHRTSMLQDLERGRRLELEALVGTVIELADLTDRSVPTIETIYALTTLLETTHYSP